MIPSKVVRPFLKSFLVSVILFGQFGHAQVIPLAFFKSRTVISQWSDSLGGTAADYGFSVAVDSSGNVYVAGHYNNNSSNSNSVKDFAGANLNGKTSTASTDVFVTKFDANGVQRWIKTLGGSGADQGYSVAVDGSGNVYVAGDFYNTTANANSVTDFNGNALAGKTTTASSDAFVAKLNSNGSQLWIKTLGGTSADGVQSVKVDSGGNVYVAGAYTGSAADFNGSALGSKGGLTDTYVAKLDSSGSQLWIKALGGSDGDYAYSVSVDGGSNVYVAGYYANSTANAKSVTDFAGNILNGKTTTLSSDLYVAKLNPSGTQLWIKTLGGTNSDGGRSVVVDIAGNVYVAGYYGNSSSNAAGVLDFAGNTLNGKTATNGLEAVVAKLDSSGNQLWIRSLGGSGSEYTYALALDSNSNVYVSGFFTNSSSNSSSATDFGGSALLGRASTSTADAFVSMLDSSGSLVWIKTLGGASTDVAYSVIVDSNENTYVVGYYNNDGLNTNSVTDFNEAALRGKSTSASADVFVVKIKKQ
jgi:arginine repressor